MIKRISTLGYGVALISPEVFENTRKELKIRSKKMLTYFDKKNSVFYDFINKGAFLPISKIKYGRYELLFNLSLDKKISNEWEIIKHWDNFNLKVENDTLWALNFEEMQNWYLPKLSGLASIDGIYYDFEDNEHKDFLGIKYDIPSGNYKVEINALQKKIKVPEKELEDYGFLFKLTKVNDFSKSSDPSETQFHKMFD